MAMAATLVLRALGVNALTNTGLALTTRPRREQDGLVHAMTTDTVRAAPAPLDVARALAPRIRARADEIEAARELPADLVMELANARLFKVALPEAEGGLGADILTALRVIEEVSRADGSTGWCLAMAINTFRQSAQLAPEVRRKLFSRPARRRRGPALAPTPPRRRWDR
jgi:alkylation response protein AidB-like acyl-CoA dehydrogenase